MCHCCRRKPAHTCSFDIQMSAFRAFFKRQPHLGNGSRRMGAVFSGKCLRHIAEALGLNEFGDLVVTSRGVHLIQRMGWCWFWLRNESLKQKKARVADLKRGAAAVLAWKWAIGWENGIWRFNQDWENWIALGRFKQSWKQQEFDKLVGTFTAQAVLDNVPDPTASLRPFLLSPRFTAWRSTPESGMQATDLWH